MSYNSVCIIVGKQFYKVSLSKEAKLFEEYINCKTLEKYLGCNSYLPNMDFIEGRYNYLKMEVLLSLTEDELNIARSEILHCFSRYSTNKITKASEHKNIVLALIVLKSYMNVKKFEQLEKYLEMIFSNEIRVGIVHGDFHSSNIMKDENGVYKVIDFDCVIESGMQLIDDLNFSISKKCDYSKRDWKEVLADLNNNVDKLDLSFKNYSCTKTQMLFLYFLDRIGKIYSFYNEFNESNYNLKVDLIDYYLEKKE